MAFLAPWRLKDQEPGEQEGDGVTLDTAPAICTTEAPAASFPAKGPERAIGRNPVWVQELTHPEG